MEHAENISEQPICSREQMETCEQAGNAPDQECSVQSAPGEAACSSEQPEACEQVILSSGEETRSPEPPKCSEPGKENDLPEMTDAWLRRFVGLLQRTPALWRPGQHSTHWASNCKPKSARGFAYKRLLQSVEPDAKGDQRARITRAVMICRKFFSLLKQQLRRAAAHALELNSGTSPDEALRDCPIWVRRADCFLNQMPLVFAQINAQRNDKKRKVKTTVHPPQAPAPRLLTELQDAADAGAALMRRVVRGMRRAARGLGGPTRAAAAAVAGRLRDTCARIHELWCGMRKLSMYKLRASIARGDAPSDTGRLEALDWAIVDLLLLYNAEIVTESQFQNYEQLSALLGTFHLVQRFELEKYQVRVSPQEWVDAARWYSRNRVQMSALALQKRWYELKVDTRRRFQAQLKRKDQPLPLPLHQAIIRRYPHVVQPNNHRSWRQLVAAGDVAPLTSERGPAPGEDPVRRDVGDDDSSEDDTAPVDDDDVAIVEKTLETIDLSEDNKEEEKTKAVTPPKKEEVAKCSRTGSLDWKEVYKEIGAIDTSVPELAANTSDKPVAQKERTLNEHDENLDKHLSESSTKDVPRKNVIDKTIDTNQDIVDLDTPSPEADVLDALRDLDVAHIETTIVFDSDDDDDLNVNNKDPVVSDDVNVDKNRSKVVTDNESQVNTARKRKRRESSDSSDGNLVIDCDDDDYSDGNSDNDAKSTRNPSDKTCHKTIKKMNEKEMLHEPLNKLPTASNLFGGESSKSCKIYDTRHDTDKSENNKEVSITPENTTEFPEPSQMQPSCIDKDSVSADKNMKVYYNIKRFHMVNTPKVYSNKKGDSVSEIKSKSIVSKDDEEELSSDDCRSIDESREGEAQTDNEGTIDPKLLMYAVVILEKIDCLTRPLALSSSTSRESLPTSLLKESLPRSPSPDISSSLLIKSERQRSSSPIMSTSSTESSYTYRASTPLLSRITPPRATSPLSRTTSPLSMYKEQHRHSIFQSLASLPPKFVFNKKNIPLIRLCRPCSVVLQRMETETGRVSRVAKKVELPDIEEVRRNNRSMLTAQVAPRRARLPACETKGSRLQTTASGSSLSPSSGSDSDWTPDGERLEPAESDSDEERRARGVSPAELGRLLDDLADEENDDCGHSKSTGMRGPAAAVFASNCARCAARVLSAPPSSGHEARLQRQLLRRAVRMAKAPEPNTASTSTTSTTTPTATSSTAPSTATPTVVMTKAPEKRERSKSKKPKTRPSSPLPPPPPPPPRPPRPRSPVDAEAAAREWLRQKNIAAEKFGLKPRSYKKPAPVVQEPTTPATIQPVDADITPSTVTAPPKQPFSIVVSSAPPPARPAPVPPAPAALTPVPSAPAPAAPAPPTPPLFNPDAVADINKKLEALAPTDNSLFRPLITNVTSLSRFATKPAKLPLPDVNLDNEAKAVFLVNKTKAQKNIIIIPSSKPRQEDPQTDNQMPQVVNVAGGVHLSASSVGQGLHLVVSQKSPQKNPTILPNYINQPNIVVSGNVIQGIQSSSWSKNTWQNPNYLVTSMPQTRPPLLLNSVLAGSSDSQPSLVLSTTDSMSRAVLISTVPRSSTVVSGAQVNCEPPSLFNSMPGRTVHPSPMVVRSVQAGPSASHSASQRNEPASHAPQYIVAASQSAPQYVVAASHSTPQYVVAASHTMPQRSEPASHAMPQIIDASHSAQRTETASHTMPQRVTASHSMPQRVTASHSMPQRVTASHSMPQRVTASHSMPQRVTASHSTPQRVTASHSMPQIVTASHSMPQIVTASHSMPQIVTASHSMPQIVTASHSMPQRVEAPSHSMLQIVEAPSQLARMPEPGATRDSDDNTDDNHDTSQDVSLAERLSWAPSVPSRAWAAGRDTTNVSVLCTGDERWLIEAKDGRKYYLVSEEQKPPKTPVYWALRPRIRLILPGEEDEPAAKKPKMAEPTDSTEAKPGYLKVRAFARMPPEPEGPKEPEKLLAPPRVFVNKMVYQKLSDEPLVYAKLLVPVPDPRACRGLLARGAALQLYCLRTGKLYPLDAELLVPVPDPRACRGLLARGAALQLYCLRTGKLYPLDAEPKKDVSRITLSGDEDVSGALLALAKQLYRTPAEDSEEAESDPEEAKQGRMTGIPNTVENIIEDFDEDLSDPSVEQPLQHAVQQAVNRVGQQAGQQYAQQADQHAGEGTSTRNAHSVLLNILASKTIQTQPQPSTAHTDVIELSDED